MSPAWDDWLAVCGLKREAQIWGGRAVCGGGRSDLLAQRIEAAIAERRPAGIISFGLCGALQARLAVGDLVSVRWVIEPGAARVLCDPEVHGRIARLTGAQHADMIGLDHVASDVAEKARLGEVAAAVDMESHIAARAAQAHGLTLAVLRAVSDDAAHGLPPAVVAGMAPDGGVALGAVLSNLARDPRQLPALIRMAGTSGKAFKALAAARAKLG